MIIGIPILNFFNYTYGFILLSYVVSSSISMMVSALLRGNGHTDQYAVFNFLTRSSQILLNALFIAGLSLGVEGMLLASIISQLCFSFIFIIKFKIWKFIDLSSIDKDKILQFIKYSLPLIPNKLSWTIINLSDRLIIINALGESSAGIYAISNKFPTLLDTIYGFFYQAWKESSARIVTADDRDSFYNSIYLH